MKAVNIQIICMLLLYNMFFLEMSACLEYF